MQLLKETKALHIYTFFLRSGSKSCPFHLVYLFFQSLGFLTAQIVDLPLHNPISKVIRIGSAHMCESVCGGDFARVCKKLMFEVIFCLFGQSILAFYGLKILYGYIRLT